MGCRSTGWGALGAGGRGAGGGGGRGGNWFLAEGGTGFGPIFSFSSSGRRPLTCEVIY